MASLQSSRAFLPLIAFRWLLWALAIAMLNLRGEIWSDWPSLATILVAATAIYTLVWSRQLPKLARRAERQPVFLLLDLLASALPVWLTGGWSSPFTPFVFGALALPATLFRWRGAVVAIVAYLLVDQIVGWTSWQAGARVPFATPLGVLGYVLPIIAAASWPLGVQLLRARSRRASGQTSSPSLARHPAATAPGQLVRSGEPQGGAANRAASGATAAAWSLARARPQTLEHPPALELYASIQHAVADAEEHGLTVRLTLGSPQPTLPQDSIQLLTKAVEVGLDNIRRHAHTREAEVAVTADSAWVTLSIRDRGAGLLDGTAEPPGFHQLKRLRYRLEEVEGSLDVREDETGGVLVVARVPSGGDREQELG